MKATPNACLAVAHSSMARIPGWHFGHSTAHTHTFLMESHNLAERIGWDKIGSIQATAFSVVVEEGRAVCADISPAAGSRDEGGGGVLDFFLLARGRSFDHRLTVHMHQFSR